MTDDGRDTAYSARQAYQNYAASVAYGKTSRLAGPLTLYRRRVERRAITELLVRVPQGSTVLDCPCGNGRWFDLLAGRAGRIIGVDISAAMLQRARARPSSMSTST
ncbi:MAG: methyltransferase domain-containing protein [Proteobacteria bacterium]|nr:methyltransferase domain-containing protein [Pseudomonadota bacterium]